MAQVRGSIPLRWGEAGSFMSLKPRPELDGGGERTSDHLHLDPLSQHLTALQQTYGEVALLSLIEQKEASHERAMGLVFERLVRSFLDRVRGGVRGADGVYQCDSGGIAYKWGFRAEAFINVLPGS